MPAVIRFKFSVDAGPGKTRVVYSTSEERREKRKYGKRCCGKKSLLRPKIAGSPKNVGKWMMKVLRVYIVLQLVILRGRGFPPPFAAPVRGGKERGGSYSVCHGQAEFWKFL